MSVSAKTLQPLASGNAGPPGQKLRLDNAQDYLNRMIKELRGQGNEKKSSVVAILEYLSQHISQTREQIGSLRSSPQRSLPLSGTADELEEVVSETAKATHDIISAAEEIERLASKTDAETASALNAAVIRIYEASSFQDISGQRIAKAISALQFIDARVNELIQACGPLPTATKPVANEDELLLNGPQLKRDACRQKEIDELFGGA